MKKRYKILRLINAESAGVNGLELYSTDPQVLLWLETEVRKIVPSCKRDENESRISCSQRYDFPAKDNNPSGDYFFIRLVKLNDRNDGIKAWLIRLLLDRYWEPYEGNVWFRLCENDSD